VLVEDGPGPLGVVEAVVGEREQVRGVQAAGVLGEATLGQEDGVLGHEHGQVLLDEAQVRVEQPRASASVGSGSADATAAVVAGGLGSGGCVVAGTQWGPHGKSKMVFDVFNRAARKLMKRMRKGYYRPTLWSPNTIEVGQANRQGVSR
jgi:hypothetical protein